MPSFYGIGGCEASEGGQNEVGELHDGDEGAVVGRCGNGKARDGQTDEYELGSNCCEQSAVGKQT